MNFFMLPVPLLMFCSCCSHLAVSSADFRSGGTMRTSCLPLEVGWISLPLRSMQKESNSFSMMSALVAGVPKPLVCAKTERS